MPHFESSYPTHDGKRLYTQIWEPDGERKAAIFLIHGLAEHSGRYAHFADKMNRHGCAVHTFDGRGHGQSELPKPSAYFSNMDDYLRDVDGLFRQMKAAAENIPCFLFGHSMGGGITVAYALKYRPETAGILLSGAALQPGDDVSPFLISMSSLLSFLTPRLKVLQLDSDHLSNDPEVVARYNSDPLVYTGKIPARTGAEILRMTQFIQQSIQEFDFPVLIMHGTADLLSSPDGSKTLYERARSEDKTLRLYEGFFHELINEVEKERVMDDMLAWMEKRRT